VKVDCYAADIKTSTDYFRATSSGYDNDEMLAYDKALINTKKYVVSEIWSVVMATFIKFIDQSSFGKRTNFKEMFIPKINQKIKEVLDQELTDYTVVCQNTTQMESGMYQSDISIEVNKSTIVNQLNSKMSSSNFSHLFDVIKFEQLLNEEIQILINTQKTQEENTIK